eukprot:3848377-Prymnesium_polylepis.1
MDQPGLEFSLVVGADDAAVPRMKPGTTLEMAPFAACSMRSSSAPSRPDLLALPLVFLRCAASPL